ncbi:MAG: saccharopine dehydrogenase family protein [Acidobacteriota bacterium]
MGFRYLLLGAGRQGVAAGYDLARFGQADSIVVADVNEDVATLGAARINRLIGREVAIPRVLDANDPEAVRSGFKGVEACLNSVHYALNIGLTRLAIECKVHMTDLGGNTDVVREQLLMSDAAKRAGVAIVPDCGMGPGLNISLATYVMDLVDVPQDVRIWDGGLPQQPDAPWNYALTFNIAGLTNEYDGCATFIRDGKLTQVPCFEDVEEIEFPGLGKLEAFVTSGGLSTAPWTFSGKLRRLENKTVRYKGHAQMFKAFVALGLLDTNPIRVGSVRVAPRDVLHTLLEPKIKKLDVQDVCVMRVRCDGMKDGRAGSAIVELVDRYDLKTGFTAMQRLTGWHASLMLIAAMTGQISAGVTSVERALPGLAVVDEIRRRGFALRTELRAGSHSPA